MTSTALPPRFLATALVALGLNGVWAVTLPTTSGRIVAGCGVLVSALSLLAVFASLTVRQRLTATPPAFFVWPVSLPLVSIAFLLRQFSSGARHLSLASGDWTRARHSSSRGLP